jgi:hypothetical protein
MIWLLTLPPFCEQVVSLFQSSCVSLVKPTDGGGEGIGVELSHTMRKELVLYKSFDTPWPGHLSKVYKMATFTRAAG